MECSTSFVPKLLVEFLLASGEWRKGNVKASSFFFRGVCLIIDISGFTALSEAFCEAGKKGIDGLQVCTNGYIGELVNVVHSYGGDIIKFAGDALICVFAEIDSSNIRDKDRIQSIPLDTAVRAATCADQIRRVRTDRLTVHVGMSCGEMCFGILGGVENRWECLISGPCIHELSQCLDDAPSMQAVMTAGCAELLQARATSDLSSAQQPTETTFSSSTTSVPFRNATTITTSGISIRPLSSDNYMLVAVNAQPMHHDPGTLETAPIVKPGQQAAIDALIRQFVPAPIVEELDSATGLSYFAEIREVVTMFMKWDSYDVNDKHRDLLELQPCFFQAQRILQSTGAYLRQFLVDDKGCVLIACWGMPNMSYLDNAHRALTAAAQIRTQFHRFRMETSVGITCADVYCGTVGSMERMEYAAIGSEVNMAARLMGKAKGRLLVSESAYSRLPVSDQASLQAIAPMMVKGRTEPLQAYVHVSASEDFSRVKESSRLEISPEVEASVNAWMACITPPPKGCDHPGARFSGSGEPWRGSGKTISSAVFRSALYTPPSTNPARAMLINGKGGTGKSCVAAWLRERAAAQSVSVISVRLQHTLGNHRQDFIWKRVFAQLLSRWSPSFDGAETRTVVEIIRTVFPDLDRLTEFVSLTTLGEALGTDGLVSELSMKPTQPRRRSSLGFMVQATKTHDPRHLRNALIKIFVYLLNDSPALLVIENVHLAGESCLDLLVHLLPKLSHPSAVALTATGAEMSGVSELTQNLMEANNVASMRANESPWFITYLPMIARMKAVSALSLAAVSSQDISRMLSAALEGKQASPELLQLVLDFSGGSFFWVREILQFIRERGIEQFLSAVGEGTPHGGDHEGRTRIPPSPLKRGASMFRSGQLQRQRSESDSRPRVGIFNSASSQRTATDPHHSHLDKLLLVRFGGLPVDAQRLLRTASAIGMTFDKGVLLAVLPRHLKAGAQTNLDILLQQQWLFKDPDDDQQYAFAHPHAQQVIYELTPCSERNHLYAQIAKQVEELHSNDPAYFTALSHYYRHYDTEKALQYVAKAVTVMLMNITTIIDFADAIELLGKTVVLCKSAQDAEVLATLFASCRRGIERYDTSGHASFHATLGSAFYYFADCFRTPASIVPDKYADANTESRVGAPSTAEKATSDALLQMLHKHELSLHSCVFEGEVRAQE